MQKTNGGNYFVNAYAGLKELNDLEVKINYVLTKAWGQMSVDERKNRLDRLLVYLTIEYKSFRLKNVIEVLKEKGLNIDIVDINESLERLLLGYVIGKYKGDYHYYKVPLLKERLFEEDLEDMIEGEVEGLR